MVDQRLVGIVGRVGYAEAEPKVRALVWEWLRELAVDRPEIREIVDAGDVRGLSTAIAECFFDHGDVCGVQWYLPDGWNSWEGPA